MTTLADRLIEEPREPLLVSDLGPEHFDAAHEEAEREEFDRLNVPERWEEL